MKSIAVIPARYGSTRFPGKVLTDILGKPMIQWVYERVKKSSVDFVCVATDDERVAEAVAEFGGDYVMTSADHPSGTDRVHEAVRKKAPESEIIINVQGDEPLIPPELISRLSEIMKENPEIEMATIAVPCRREEIADNPNVVKITIDKSSNALYFSRAPIPFLRTGGTDTNLYRHWGIYAFRRDTLDRFVSLPESSLEKCEKLEQLRALENGIRIKVLLAERPTVGVDTPEDLETLKEHLRKNIQH